MKNRKGFTLIELLAVIVILAIIALIAVPQVMKILNQARISAAEDSTYGIYNAVQDYISKVMIDNGGDFPNEDLTFTCDTESCKLDNYAALSSEYNLEETLEYKGKKATGGKIKITNGGKDIVFENLVVSGFTCNYSDEKATCEKGGSSSGNNNTNTIGTLASNVHIGDYIEYDPTAGVTDASLLSYTSPIGEFKVYSGTGNDKVYAVNSAADSNTETYNKAYELIDVDGNIVINNGTITGTDEVTYTVESDISGNGNSSQSFQATSSNNMWRVLDVNTTTGVVKIIPENEIKTNASTPANFYMKGLRGYKNAITELNNISEIFGHGTGATGSQSITIEEINALTGYTPTAVTTGTNITITKDNVSETKSFMKTFYSYQGTSKPGKTGTNETYGVDNSTIYEMLMKRNNTTDKKYWIASPCADVNSISANFGMRYIIGEHVNFSYYLWNAHHSGSENYNTFNDLGVLPVVTLQSSVNVKAVSGRDGSSAEKAWQFQ